MTDASAMPPLDDTAGQAAFQEWKNWFGQSALPYPFEWGELTITGRTTWEKIAMAAIKFRQDKEREDAASAASNPPE